MDLRGADQPHPGRGGGSVRAGSELAAPDKWIPFDAKNNRVVFCNFSDLRTLETFARRLCIGVDCRAGLAMPLLSGAQARRSSMCATLSPTQRLGDAVTFVPMPKVAGVGIG